MKLFLILLIAFLPFSATVTNDCNNCSLETVVSFHGEGFTPKKYIALQVIWPNGFSQNFLHSAYPNIKVPASGIIDFQFGLTTQIGIYTVNIYEVNGINGGKWNYTTSSTFEIVN